MRGVEKTFVVYIMANTRRGALYVGVTSDLFARVWQHKTNAFDGHTSRYGIKSLVWHGEATADADAAFNFEKRLKRWRRPWKFELIEKLNPEWRDLAAGWFDVAGGGALGGPGSAPGRGPGFGRDDGH